MDINTGLLQTLENIKKFGYANSGYGYSCAKMADEALKQYERLKDEQSTT